MVVQEVCHSYPMSLRWCTKLSAVVQPATRKGAAFVLKYLPTVRRARQRIKRYSID